MLEGLAAWVLNTYVGEYVENLNTAQLSIALLQGAVELENLPLKKDALKSLDIPIEVKSGFIGKIRLNIPLRRLRSEPWVISIEKLYLVAGPLSKLQYDEEEEKKKEQASKKTMLDALEEKWKIYRQNAPPDSSSSSWFSYGASMATNVIENIQLKVKDVHIRYEDDTLNPSCPFAAGIVVKNLSLQSTDASWTPKFVSQDEADSMFKLVDLQECGIYCDTDVSMLSHLSMADLADELERGMYRTRSSNVFQEHNYILTPIIAQAKVTRKISALPLRSPTTPRITVELTLGELPLTLATEQFQSLNLWLREFSRHGRRRKFRRCRPRSSVSSCPRQWWRFAQQSHLHIIKDRNNRCTKAFLVERARALNGYSAVYSCHLKGENLTPQQKMMKSQVEDNLTFEELKLIREAVFYRIRKNRQLDVNSVSRKSPSAEPTAPPITQPVTDSGSLFQRWFPGWSGWTRQATPTIQTSEASTGSSESPGTESPSLSQSSSTSSVVMAGYEKAEDAEENVLNEDEIEQEIQDVIKDSSENSSFLRKDTVFACMKFLLKKATFKLVETRQALKSPLVELQCSTIGIDFESRPRTSAMKFSLSLGSLVVLNQTATKPVFTHVIYPQSKDVQSRALFSPTPHLPQARSGGDPTAKQTEFFQLVYEKNPSKIFKYSLNINSQPLDIIYMPEIINRVKDLFTLPITGAHRSAYSLSSWQFDKLRKQTQEELKNTLDQLMEGKASHWSINMDICAPKIVIPENVTESNPQLMVLDLGNFRLKTLSNIFASSRLDGSKEEDEDKFETPLSTPPNETAEDAEVKQTMQGAAPPGANNLSSPEVMSDILFRDKLYEKYGIELTDMQVVVGHLHDNWRHAYARGTSLMHIVDRFSISIQLERRLIVTSDAQWPSAKLSGKLPSLTFHLNEWKIQALQKCMDRLSEHKQPSMSQMASIQLSSFDSTFGEPSPSLDTPSSDISDALSSLTKESHEDNKLIVLQFLISSLSVEVQSQGQPLIELQVTGVRATLHTKPANASLVLTVHSLLLVDAMQTYGQDFELLVASHKNIILDSRSGSIRGSELNSPMSPLSPSSPASPSSPTPGLTPSISFSSFQSIQDAISNAFHSVMPHASHSAEKQREAAHEEITADQTYSQSKALILLEYEVITTPSSSAHGQSEETSRVLNLQFNSLDFIANQETLVEIMSFVNRTFPMSTPKPHPTQASSLDTSIISAQNKNNEHIHINADFKRLNVMLVRFLNTDGHKTARKVATATISCSRLQAQMEETWEIEGSLGGLHLLDVTPEGSMYQQVISIGHIQQTEAMTGGASCLMSPSVASHQEAMMQELYNSSFPHDDEKNACTFVVKKMLQSETFGMDFGMVGRDASSMNDLSGLAGGRKSNVQAIEAKFDMASLCYIHCPKFLDELMDCMSEFKDYVTKVATSIKSAATEVAMGMVGVRGEYKDGGLNLTNPGGAPVGHAIRRDQSLGDITNTVLLEEMPSATGFDAAPSRSLESSLKVMLYVNMESPILVIPRTPNSPQVLLAHLGEILMNNSSLQEAQGLDWRGPGSGMARGQDLLNLSLTNMNLFSVSLQPDLAFPTVTSMSTHLSELTQSCGVPILYDTSVDLVIGKRDLDIPFINPDVSGAVDGIRGLGMPSPRKPASSKDVSDEENFLKSVSSVLDVRAKISSPLKLSLSKEVYEQILQTTDNLTYDADVTVPQSVPVGSPSHPGLSSAKLSSGTESESSSGQERSSNAEVEDMGQEAEQFLAKHVDFEVPLFQVELRGDFGEGEQGLVELKLYDFAVKFEKNDKVTTRINLHLKSLQMDDLLEAPDSKHRQIIVSRPSQSQESQERQHLQPKNLMSTSCPDSTIITPVPQMPSSLPASFSARHNHMDHVQFAPCHQQQQPLQSHLLHRKLAQSQRWLNSESPGLYPCTPPPSPLARDLGATTKPRQDDLVYIDVILVDKKRPEYFTVHNKTNRFIDINFACLDATINLQTWVVLLDFLGLGAKVHDMPAGQEDSDQTQHTQGPGAGPGEKEDINSEINFKVESFTLIFNKPEYELAQATVGNLNSHISLREGNLWATGQLGSLSLLDQSPNGHLYRQRFTSTGRQLVEFDFFKYGLPDFAMQRQYDISLKLRMSSVRYVHTNRFQSELVAFIQHFLQLQDVLGRMRAASAGKKITEAATRGARILLDIEAASPILLIPHSSETDGLLVADLGNLKLKNQFIVDGKTGTLRASKAGNSAHMSSSAFSEGESKAFQKGIIHRGMTESQLNMSFPPTRPLDPMTQSVYGSLDHDFRVDHPDSSGLNATNDPSRPNMKRHVSEPFLSGRNQAGPKGPGLNPETVSEQTMKDPRLDSGEEHMCLLDVISVTLSDMDLFPARRVAKSDYKRGDLARDMEFSTYIVERGHDCLLEEKCHLELHIEHNLEGEVSHSAPDFSITGKLSSINCKLDGAEYELVRGILNHNLGEKLEEFRRPLMSHLLDPKIETVLGGSPWKVITLVIDLRNVAVELLRNHAQGQNSQEKSLGRFDFIRSQLSFSSFSNQVREIGLVSNEILMYDTRFKNEPVNSRPNVFTSILQPSPGLKSNKGLQVEMNLRSAPDSTHFTCLLNNMRLMCIFDFLLAMREFISKEPPDPFKARQAPSASVAPEMADFVPTKSSRNQSPLTVSRGIITKRGPLVEEVKVPFELVLNFTDTQFVVVEDSTSLDTNAVILKNTAVIIYKPQAQDRVLTCSLQSVELFSCCLMAEEDTALSIIDPTGISIELNANPLPQPSAQSSGLLGLRDAQRRQLVLEVNLKTLNIRVSYHDMVMFLAIMNSLPQQAKFAQLHQDKEVTPASPTTPTPNASKAPPSSSESGASAATRTSPSGFFDKEKAGSRSLMGGMLAPCVSQKEDREEEVEQLMSLGFAEGDVRKALAAKSWNVTEAALWLTENAAVATDVLPAHVEDSSPDFMITSVEFNADSIVLCLIDDCGDADIPLVEVSCNGIAVKQEIVPVIEGKASFQLLAEYYNRRLSGWEPCLEPWRCFIEWKQYTRPETKLAIQLAASDVLNLNMTSTLLELYQQTRGNWTQDYLYQRSRGRPSASSTASSLSDASNIADEGTSYSGNTTTSLGSWPASRSGPSQRRSPFIPYVLRNDTGCNLWFLTATTTPSNLSGENSSSQMLDSAYIQASDWKRVSPGETRPFHFHRREKLRHQKSHAMHINQLLVTVEGWQRLFPVSVDKVGTYFRHADPDLKAAPNAPPARIVFEVQQEGSAKKLIIVRSALVILNLLDSPVELRMESTDETGQYQCMMIPINQSIPVPLSCINARLRARPSDWPVHFCTKPLDWQHVKRVGDRPDGIRTCGMIGSGMGSFSFFVCVSRLRFPEESILLSTSAHHSPGTLINTMPGHVLMLMPPITIRNRLPLELHYYLKGTEASGNLKAGKQAALHGVDVSQNFDLGIHLENFPTCKELTIPPNTSNRKVNLRIFDNKNRMLKLMVRIQIIKGGSMRLTILAPFWLVNKSGLPLVFRQDGSKQFAAGQFQEHEQARSMTPLLFSFPEVEEANLCSRFSLEGGTSKRALHVIQIDGNRPDWVYTIGIQVTQGRGCYRGTNIVTFASHFELDNQSSYKLAIVQHFMTKKEETASQAEHLIAFPQCKLRFHWPRVDLDQLLCVKILDIPGCRWSGGFYIDKIDSFHINMRDATGKCHLLKVEVVQEGPTFFIVFADADVMPPPFRIVNFSEVPVMFYQSRTVEEKLKAFIQPHTSIPYAWDEPTVKPLKLTLSILGGTSASYSLDKLEEGEQLHYENFIYLAATTTFDRNWEGHWPELVLDCVHSHNVVFKRKEKSKRSQLWRMTGSGMLEHEGSMPPRDPRNPSNTGEPGLVLDIADLAPRPGQSVPLILRKPDGRRRSTQTWRFTEQGQLCCLAGYMCVQAVGGSKGLQDGAIAILGPGPNYQEQDQHQDPQAVSLPMMTSYPSFPLQSPMPQTLTSSPESLTASHSSIPSEKDEARPNPHHMLISRQKLRPGSGCVSVKVTMDGPIRVIELVDIQQRRWHSEYAAAAKLSMLLAQKQVVKRLTMEKDLDEWEVYDEIKGQQVLVDKPTQPLPKTNIELSIAMKDGIGVSVVNGLSEELLYVTLKNINVEVNIKPTSITVDTSIALIQADNQIKGAQNPVIMYVTPLSRRDVLDNTPALHVSAHKVPSAKWKAEIFKHLYVSTKRMTVHLEEQLLWKLMQFAGLDKDDRTLDHLDETYDSQRILPAITSIQATRYYFGTVKLNVSPVTLSMVTSSKLTPDLKAIKNAMSMTLIAFEQAHIDMRSFEQYHMFETGPFLLSEIKNHYTEELISQAAKILGSVDFLGNPLGLVHDITEGITGLVKDGNISGLVKNVTHGVSNSTAKVMSSLSDGISTVGLDEDHNSRREALRNVSTGSSSDHLMAGFKGLSHGILGGVTSLVSQSISGAQNEGFGGLIKGVGKGMIGTVTKPVSGVLDLTSGLANALRDSSTRTSHRGPGRLRTPRCTHGPGGLLSLYLDSQADAQSVLYELNNNDFSEYLIAMEQLVSIHTGEGNMHALITSRQVYFLNQRRARQENIVLKISHADILQCTSITTDGKYYVELTRRTTSSSDVASTSLNKPRVRCEKLLIAKKVAQEIKYAKNLYDERTQTLEIEDTNDEGDW